MTYTISLISTDENERLRELYIPKVLYEIKSEIYGCCIKLLSDDHTVKETWQDNFYPMSQNIRSHGRIFVFKDPACGPDTVFFDPHSRSAYLINFNYYGWIKSIALSLAGDILEDEHNIYSVHGACMDIDGKGLCLIGNSGAGKTTQTYGLLKDPHTRIVSDDWFFSRVYMARTSLPMVRKKIFIYERISQPSGRNMMGWSQKVILIRKEEQLQISGG